MPPKSKKQQEEEAARLAEQQRKRQEQQARLVLQRQKYAAQIASTGLLLPASNQLILDLSTQPVAVVIQKLQQAIKDHCSNLDNDPIFKKLVLKEMLYYLVESSKIFSLQKLKEVAGNEDQFLKARILVGIAFKVMTHEHKALGGQGKTKRGDQRLVKEQLGLHIQKGEGKMKIFNAKETEAVLNCLGAGYFNHYLLLQHYRTFNKLESQTEQHIYISTPNTFYNNKNTPFEDLTQPEKPQQPQAQAEPQPAE